MSGDFWSARYRDYSPAGGVSPATRRREQCRRAARASAIRRKQLARGRRIPWARDGDLPLQWKPIRQLTRSEFDAAYGAMCAREGLKDDTRGRNTAYALYRAEIAAYRVRRRPEGQTTNGQRQVSLSSQGRPRCRRTVQLTRKRLQAMGVVRYEHIRRRGAESPRDTLRVELLGVSVGNRRSRRRANCTPPPEAGAAALQADAAPARKEVIAPASPAENGPAPPGLGPPSGGGAPPAPSDEKGEPEREFWDSPTLAAIRARLESVPTELAVRPRRARGDDQHLHRHVRPGRGDRE